MVLKGSHSCAGREVKVVAKTKHDKLLCKAPVPGQAAKRAKRGRHQHAQTHRFFIFTRSSFQHFGGPESSGSGCAVGR